MTVAARVSTRPTSASGRTSGARTGPPGSGGLALLVTCVRPSLQQGRRQRRILRARGQLLAGRERHLNGLKFSLETPLAPEMRKIVYGRL